MTAKTELLSNHFHHALDELARHLTEAGDIEALADIRRLVELAVEDALCRCKPV